MSTGRSPKIEKLGSKLSNFKTAVATHVGGIGDDHEDRSMRYHTLLEHAGSSHRHAPHGPVESFQHYQEKERDAVSRKSKIWTTDDFQVRKVIGEGTFGVVYLARIRSSGELCALKQMKKAAYTRKNHRERVYGERDILAEAQSRWIVDLLCTFQDSENIYMAMEFLQGGDLVYHLLKKRRLSLEETRFYMAELLEALSVVHGYGFVHRDVKPDNTVLTAAGHLKLLDFGLCRQDFDGSELHLANAAGGNVRPERVKSVVGTPEYMAPETFLSKYGPESDVWSVGVITFELLVGVAPFNAGRTTDGVPVEGKEKIKIIKDKIQCHTRVLPDMLEKAKRRGRISTVAEDFLLKVVCDCNRRLTIGRCRSEAFFGGLDFTQLHSMTPPIKPELSGLDDLKYFDEFEDQQLPPAKESTRKDSDIDWANYEYDHQYSNRSKMNTQSAGLDASGQERSGYPEPIPPARPPPNLHRTSLPPLHHDYIEIERWIANQEKK